MFRSVAFFFISIFLFPFCVFAREDVRYLRGHAIVEWSAKKRVYRFDQAVVIKTVNEASFETLDDFGNTVLRLDFTGGDVMLARHALSLPLSRDEFISYLLYQLPEQVDGLDAEYDADGRLIGVEKKSKQAGKRYKISFRDFEKKGKILYPKTIEITSRKGNLKISWRNVELNI
ncbi:MAG: hypothetical protein A3F09_01305 [Chlamydiae bacterium RIFCSPHIGHO2_12_FULL_49_11]|nr:MAG: hypothetical protein A3F09_01305 [Chlamydiae bacterium RIFCSPHIGHO2_12_FULL_49_11]